MKKLEIISGRERDLGGFSVKRVLPEHDHTMVGPFIFFDHIGPAEFAVGTGIDVRPHPHIHLATVTYLFEGQLCHRDSLGTVQIINTGEINWMIAGHGIVHSERTPAETRKHKQRLSGIQCWIALPESHENIAPSFTHYGASVLPTFNVNGAVCKLLLGKAFGKQSPVTVFSDLFYLSVTLPKDTSLTLAEQGQEAAVYVSDGEMTINDVQFSSGCMAVSHEGEPLNMKATRESQVMLLGGQSIGKRTIYWNYVSSSEAAIEQAKKDWEHGPGAPNSRFPKIPGDDQEYIPLPLEKEEHPKGTVL